MPMNRLWVGSSEGAFELDPAYTYSKLRGSSTAGSIVAPAVNQFVAQFDDFAARIQSGAGPDRNSGQEGLVDLRIIDAIYRSIAAGAPIGLA
jgi:predicted dehydrogenase